jgi:hypothetical protein
LRTNEALVGKLSVFKIGAIQRNCESIGVRAAGDLADKSSPGLEDRRSRKPAGAFRRQNRAAEKE